MNINNNSTVSFEGIYSVGKNMTKQQKNLAEKFTNITDYSDVYHKLKEETDVIFTKGPKGGISARFLHNDSFIKSDDGKVLKVNLPTDSELNISKLFKAIQDIVDGKFKMPEFNIEDYYAGKTDFFKLFPNFYKYCKIESTVQANKTPLREDVQQAFFDIIAETKRSTVLGGKFD